MCGCVKGRASDTATIEQANERGEKWADEHGVRG